MTENGVPRRKFLHIIFDIWLVIILGAFGIVWLIFPFFLWVGASVYGSVKFVEILPAVLIFELPPIIPVYFLVRFWRKEKRILSFLISLLLILVAFFYFGFFMLMEPI